MAQIHTFMLPGLWPVCQPRFRKINIPLVATQDFVADQVLVAKVNNRPTLKFLAPRTTAVRIQTKRGAAGLPTLSG